MLGSEQRAETTAVYGCLLSIEVLTQSYRTLKMQRNPSTITLCLPEKLSS